MTTTPITKITLTLEEFLQEDYIKVKICYYKFIK
jgi:hypothetical protein